MTVVLPITKLGFKRCKKHKVRSLGQEDPLEEVMATHSSILASRIPWTEEPGGLQFMGLQRVRHDWACMDITMINFGDYFPFFPLKTFRANQNLQSRFWDRSLPSPQMPAFCLKQPFHSYQHLSLTYWLSEWWVVQPKFSSTWTFLCMLLITCFYV